MNRKQLEALGLEADKVNEVMKLYGQSVNEYQTQLTTLENENMTLKNKVQDNENNANQIDALNTTIENLRQEKEKYKAEVASNKLDKDIIKAVAKEAHNPDDILMFIDKSKLEFKEDSDEIENLDDVVNALKEEKSYLFNLSDNVEFSQSSQTSQKDEPTKKGSGYQTNQQRGNGDPKPNPEEIGRKQAERLWGKKE